MPPLKNIDRGLNGSALKALEESGHGRRLAIVDASYNIPRWAQVVDYRGETSVQALIGVLKLVSWEGKIILMQPDKGTADHGDGPFCDIALNEMDPTNDLDYPGAQGMYRHDTKDGDGIKPGFYTTVNNETEDTLYLRTPDRMPYACASFIIGHSQTSE